MHTPRAVQQQISDLQIQVENLKTERENLTRQINGYSAESRRLRETIGGLEKQRQNDRAKIEEHLQTIMAQSDIIKSLGQDESLLIEQLNCMSSEKSFLRGLVEGLTKALEHRSGGSNLVVPS